MKALVNNIFRTNRIFQFSMLLSITLVAMSCKEENDTILAAQQAQNASERAGMVLNNRRMPLGEPAADSIAQIAMEANFNELVNTLAYVDQELRTELITVFSKGDDQYTVFALNIEAFFALYDALDIESIDQLSAELVRDVLYYHVVEGRRASFSVVPVNNSRTITTLSGLLLL